MKKLFTLALALLVAFGGYSQVQKVSKNSVKKNDATNFKAPRLGENIEYAESEPTMTSTREINYGELDYTYYDWQTNHGFINRTVVWPDGKVNFAYTYASSASYADRGTAIATYDSNTDEWTPMEGRIEADRTGFGSIARYGENGLVVAAHTSNNLNVYIVEDKDNMTPNTATAALNIGTDVWSHPCVATSGPNHDIIHMVAAVFDGEDNGVKGAIRYWRSSDGEEWDIVCRELPYLTSDYGLEHGTNSYYWMETTEDNMIGLVINTGNTDGIVLYSTDNGDTWQRKIYFHDPDPMGDFTDNSFPYPRWTSALWNDNNELMLAYEFNFTSHTGTYSAALGGVAFWSEYMPYRGDGSSFDTWGGDPTNPMPPTPGQPFIMDSAYLSQDIYASWFVWSDASHEMWPEYFGYNCNWTEEGYWEDPYGEEWESEWHFESVSDFENHGPYNCGSVGMPVMTKVNGDDNVLIAVWCTVDDEHMENGNYFFKLVAAISYDAGMHWSHPVMLTANEFEFMESEQVYPQIATIGDNTLIVVAQIDYGTGTSVQSDDNDPADNHYCGFVFNINELFDFYDSTSDHVSNNVHMTLFPNPAVDQLNVTLSSNAEIVVYNIMGQKVMSQEGHAGANSINVSSLNSGIYFVNAGSDTQKFIVK